MTSSFFITGTNTGVGKTITSALILSAAHYAQYPINYFKPIQTGNESDCDLVKELTGLPEHYIKRPVFSLKLSASPYQAALAEQRAIDPSRILRHWQTICATPTIVEGAGGLLVPINKNFLIRDLIKLLDLKLVIVANTIVGTINHILLTIEAAKSANINITGIILFGNHNPWRIETLREFTLIPIIVEIPWLNSLHQQSLKYISRSLFNKNILNTLFDE